MTDFNEVQKRLLKVSELAHFHGLRHKGLSGTICEDLLLRMLRKSVPELKFDRGVIKFGDRSMCGEELKANDLSTQLDVIIYRGRPLYRSAGDAVVHIDDVKGVLEIKKWAFPKMLSQVGRKVRKMRSRFQKRSGRRIRIFFVAFRFHDRHRPLNWSLHAKKLQTSNAFCFSGHYSRVNGANLYPWEESWWGKFDAYPYAGQYERLVKSIRSLQTKHNIR